MKFPYLASILSGCGLLALFACADPGKREASVPEISATHFVELYRANPSALTVLDVRSPGETASGHLPNAILIPLPELERRASELPREQPDKPLYIYCRSGMRSIKAAETLNSLGRHDAISVSGGYTGMLKAGLPKS